MNSFWAGLLDQWAQTQPVKRTIDAICGFGLLVFPTECVVCGTVDASLCDRCSRDFRRGTVRPFRAEAEATSLPESEWSHRMADAGSFEPLPVVSAGVYSDVVAQVLLSYKNKGHTDLKPQLLAALAGALHHGVHDLSDRHALIHLISVPSRSSSYRRRGYDPVSLLLQHIDKRRLLPAGTVVSSPLTYTTRSALRQILPPILASGHQKGLGRRKRATNVRGTMRLKASCRAGIAGHVYVVVDDVLTTGSTIAEVTRALRDSGGLVAGAVVIAAATGTGGSEQNKANSQRTGGE